MITAFELDGINYRRWADDTCARRMIQMIEDHSPYCSSCRKGPRRAGVLVADLFSTDGPFLEESEGFMKGQRW